MPCSCWSFAQHCTKYPYINGYFVATFPYFNRTSSVYVCVRLYPYPPVGPRDSLFRRFTDTNVCRTGSVKMWKTRHKISVDIRGYLGPFYGAIAVPSVTRCRCRCCCCRCRCRVVVDIDAQAACDSSDTWWMGPTFFQMLLACIQWSGRRTWRRRVCLRRPVSSVCFAATMRRASHLASQPAPPSNSDRQRERDASSRNV